ncbi:thioesterase II family protein [Streptomyces sp. NPDC002870]|uniref:thioesterase II family protein n=1 Tax=Streptomyces sp. NPDC002870 TaxID=3364666 RepID=UPI0036A4DDE2
MDSQWFRRFGDPGPDGPRLICFPHAGGAASSYAGLWRLLSPHLDVLMVQYPGRQDRRRETPERDITALAGRIAEHLMAGADRPYAFFGHSMGAVVAYETARALRERDAAAPLRLILSGRSAPGPRPDRHDMLDGDQSILAAVRALGGTDSAVLDDPELVAMALPALRADYGALASYGWQPGPPLNSPISVFVGDADPVVPIATVAGWGEHTSLDCEVRVFPGGHFYLGEQLDEVAEAIVDRMSAGARGPAGAAARAHHVSPVSP